MDRRDFSRAVLAAALTGFGASMPGARAQPAQAATDESIDLMLEEMVAETGGMPPLTAFGPDEIKKDEALRKAIVERVGKKLPDLTGVATLKPPPHYSIDKAHLGSDEAGPGSDFPLDGALLQNLARANGFLESFTYSFRLGAPQADLVLFGLRGCEIADPKDVGVFKPSIRLKVGVVDHVRMLCTMGIWDRKANTVAVFRASTVPHLAFVEVYRIYLALRGRVARTDVASLAATDALLDASTGSNWYSNTLSQGLHIHYIGPHGGKQPNMLRQSDDWFAPVARAKTVLGFTNSDWESPGAAVSDNIHAAYDLNPRAVIGYQSNGCNVISGSVSGGKYSGEIATYRNLLSLDQLGRKDKTIVGAKANQKFFYMLLSGAEACLQSKRPGDAALDRVRFGSTGAKAVALRKLLESVGHKTLVRRDPKDIVGRGTVEALRKEQEAVGQAKDGVLSRVRAAEIGVPWT